MPRQVDKLWSILPIYYMWHFAAHGKVSGAEQEFNPRLLIIAALITVWGVRLTYNFARKGGYRWTDEDYRRVGNFMWGCLLRRFRMHFFLCWHPNPQAAQT